MRLDPIQMMVRDFGEPVVLPGGAIVSARPSLASREDELGCESVVAGRTRTLDFAQADAPNLNDGQIVTWQSKQWAVTIRLLNGGRLLRAFLREARP